MASEVYSKVFKHFIRTKWSICPKTLFPLGSKTYKFTDKLLKCNRKLSGSSFCISNLTVRRGLDVKLLCQFMSVPFFENIDILKTWVMNFSHLPPPPKKQLTFVSTAQINFLRECQNAHLLPSPRWEAQAAVIKRAPTTFAALNVLCCGAAEAAQMQQDPVRVCQSVGLWYVYLVRRLWCCAARSVPLMTQMTLRWNASTPLLEAARRRCQMFAFVLHVLPLGLRSEPMDSFQSGRGSNISLKLTPRRPPLLSEAIVPHCNTQK